MAAGKMCVVSAGHIRQESTTRIPAMILILRALRAEANFTPAVLGNDWMRLLQEGSPYMTKNKTRGNPGENNAARQNDRTTLIEKYS